jgi:hypothetical protein
MTHIVSGEVIAYLLQLYMVTFIIILERCLKNEFNS